MPRKYAAQSGSNVRLTRNIIRTKQRFPPGAQPCSAILQWQARFICKVIHLSTERVKYTHISPSPLRQYAQRKGQVASAPGGNCFCCIYSLRNTHSQRPPLHPQYAKDTPSKAWQTNTPTTICAEARGVCVIACTAV